MKRTRFSVIILSITFLIIIWSCSSWNNPFQPSNNSKTTVIPSKASIRIITPKWTISDTIVYSKVLVKGCVDSNDGISGLLINGNRISLSGDTFETTIDLHDSNSIIIKVNSDLTKWDSICDTIRFTRGTIACAPRSNSIVKIGDNLWFCTSNGIIVEHDHMVVDTISSENSAFLDNNIKCFSKGVRTVFIAGDRLYEYDALNKISQVSVLPQYSMYAAFYYCIYFAHDGSLILQASPYDFYRLKGTSFKLALKYHSDSFRNGVFSIDTADYLFSIYPNSMSPERAMRFVGDTVVSDTIMTNKFYSKLDTNIVKISKIIEDNIGNLYFSVGDTLFRFDGTNISIVDKWGKTPCCFDEDNKMWSYMKSNSLIQLDLEGHGNVWFFEGDINVGDIVIVLYVDYEEGLVWFNVTNECPACPIQTNLPRGTFVAKFR